MRGIRATFSVSETLYYAEILLLNQSNVVGVQIFYEINYHQS